MSTNRKITEATGFKEMSDILKATVTTNLAGKAVGSAQNSLVDPAMSTAGEFAINGVIYTRAASSSMFVLQDTTIPAFGAVNFVLTLDTAGAGVGYPANVLTSAQVSAAGATPATVLAAAANVWPDVPATVCPVGIYTVMAGAVSHVSGSSSFSLVTSATGSHLFTQILNYNKLS
jgi:hypothetical protein